MAVRTQSPLPPPAEDAREPTRAPAPAVAGEGVGGEGVPPAGLPAGPSLTEVARLLERARGTRGGAQREAVGALHAALARARPAEAERRAWADLLLEALASGTLGTLRDARGRTSRAAVAAALLELGYPYALEIAPEDLEHLRQAEATPPRARAAALALLAVVLGCALGLWGAEPGNLGWVLLQGLLAGMSVDAYASATPGERRRPQGRLWAGAAALLAVLGALADPGLLLPLLGPMSAALLLDRQPR